MRCAATTRIGTTCRNGALPNSAYCYFHSVDAITGHRKLPEAITREKEIEVIEEYLRSIRRTMPSSLEKARTIIQLVELLERLRQPVPPRSLTVEERLALRRKG